MKKIAVVTDSHGGITLEEAQKLDVKVLPMPFYFEDACYYEGVSLTRADFFERLKAGETVSTSQPSPQEVMDFWKEILTEYEQMIYMPLSSGLSGACNTARMLAGEEEFEDRVFVVDNGRISTPMHRAILDALELVEEGYSAEEIQQILEAAKDKMSIYIAVETLEYLKKGGRITPATAAIGSLLNIKPILSLNIGVLDTYKKCRGMKKARRDMLEALKKDMETKFLEYYESGEIYLMAASSADEETTKSWMEEIQTYFPGMDILCDDLSLGISCHTGEGALGVGCSCRPKRNVEAE